MSLRTESGRDAREGVRSEYFGGCVVALFVTADDNDQMVALKVFLCRLGLFLGALLVFLTATFIEGAMYYAIGTVLDGVIVLTIIIMLATNWVTKRAVTLVVVECVFAIACIDMSAVTRAGFSRYWPMFLLLFFVCSIFELPESTHVTAYVIGACSLVVTCVQQVFDFDWVDPLQNVTAFMPLVCDCEHPPCAISPAIALLDMAYYAATLYFATSVQWQYTVRVREQHRKLESAIDVAEAIATCLSAFDLAAAEGLLTGATEETGHDLPPKLRAALEHILHNLKLYRPYLPDELFSHDSETARLGIDDDVAAATIPGGANGEATIVFTDIRQSTALWEHSGDAMREALTQHNEIMRTAIAAWSGYEVKTIGDAFMAAFHNVRDAVRFGVDVQKALTAARWPEGLTRPNADDGHDLLSVRIGVHCGYVSVERNTLTGRYDYFGPTVNAAARVEAHGIPGVVTVTEAVMKSGTCEDDYLESMILVPYAEARHGKGLGDALWLTAVVGLGLPRERVAHVRSLVAPARPMTVTSTGSSRSSHVPESAHAPSDRMSDISSTRDSVWHGAPALAEPGHHRGHVWQRTVRETATVGVVKFAFWSDDESPWSVAEEAIALRLQELHTHLKATSGHVSTLLHNVVLVSWGVYGRCSQHMNESVRFLMLLEEGFRGGARGRSGCGFHAGLATGPVASGQVSASSSQRLLTMLGPCVDLGLMLCGGAAEVGTAALVASVADVDIDRYECNTLLRDHLRAVDKWELCSTRRAVSVYELMLESLVFLTVERSASVDRSMLEGVEPEMLRDSVRLQHALGRWIVPEMAALE